MTKRVLITGGAGFIADHIILYILKNTDWDVDSLFNVLGELVEKFGDKN